MATVNSPWQSFSYSIIIVMKWTGHSDYKAMRPYIDITEKTKADAMKIIDNAWGE